MLIAGCAFSGAAEEVDGWMWPVGRDQQWAVERWARWSLGSNGVGRRRVGPLECLPICARNSGPAKGRAVAGTEERSQNQGTDTRAGARCAAMRCAGPKYLSESSECVRLASQIEPKSKMPRRRVCSGLAGLQEKNCATLTHEAAATLTGDGVFLGDEGHSQAQSNGVFGVL